MSQREGEVADAPDIEVALEVSGVQRTPCVLVLDTSSSMKGHDRIGKLNRGLQTFERSLKANPTLSQQVVLLVIGFGREVELVQDWVQADEFEAPALTADGLTPMGEAMAIAHAAIEDLRRKLNARGIPFTRPWIFLMSDGGPNDDGWRDIAARSRRLCEDRRTVVWPIAVPPEANGEALKAFARSDMQVYALDEKTDFDGIFEWLTTSLGALANSTPGQELQVPVPTVTVVA